MKLHVSILSNMVAKLFTIDNRAIYAKCLKSLGKEIFPYLFFYLLRHPLKYVIKAFRIYDKIGK